MKSDTIVFRTDASAAIGTGHLMRCLTLADTLSERGLHSVFVGHLEGFETLIRERGHRLDAMPEPDRRARPATPGDPASWLPTEPSADAEAFCAAVERSGVSVTIVDHYALDAQWERLVSQGTGAKIFAIDDLLRTHASEGLLDTTFSRTEADYDGLVAPDTVVLAGSRYALLRPRFAQLRAASIERLDRDFANGAEVGRLFLSLGGADPLDVTSWLLKGIGLVATELPPDLEVHILLGPAFAAHGEVRAASDGLPRTCIIHESVDDVASLLARTDLCIGAGGSSAWERCCMAIPTINVVTADNQRDVTHALVSAGAVVDGGAFEDRSARPAPEEWARSVLLPTLRDTARRAKVSQTARTITDGLGAPRVADLIVAMSRDVRLRPLVEEDGPVLFDWQSHPSTRRHFRRPAPPSREEHDAWLRARLDLREPCAWIITSGAAPAGLIRLDEDGDGDPEVSILIEPQSRGRGIASSALRLLPQVAPRERYLAEIDPENDGSQALFRRVGFERDFGSDRIWRWTSP